MTRQLEALETQRQQSKEHHKNNASKHKELRRLIYPANPTPRPTRQPNQQVPHNHSHVPCSHTIDNNLRMMLIWNAVGEDADIASYLYKIGEALGKESWVVLNREAKYNLANVIQRLLPCQTTGLPRGRTLGDKHITALWEKLFRILHNKGGSAAFESLQVLNVTC